MNSLSGFNPNNIVSDKTVPGPKTELKSPEIKESFQQVQGENPLIIKKEMLAASIKNCTASQAENKNTPNNEKELTILFYMDAQENDYLVYTWSNFFLDIEKDAGTTKDINVIAQFGRNPYESAILEPEQQQYACPINKDWTGNIRRYVIKQNEHNELDELPCYQEFKQKYPENPIGYWEIAKIYNSRGEPELAQTHRDKALELGMQEILDGSAPEKSDKLIKEFKIYKTENLRDIKAKTIFKSDMVEEFPEDAQMGNPKVLQDAIRWGMEKYPAKHFMVLIAAHGGAFLGLSDMTPKEAGEAIKNGVKEANQQSGRNDHIDALILNSCYMGNIEAVNELKDCADITVASENQATAHGDNEWPQFIQYIQKNIDSGEPFDGEKFASDIVNYYRDRNKNLKANYAPQIVNDNSNFSTITAINNKKIGGVVDSWKNLMQTCKEEGVTDKQLFTAITNAKNYPHTNDNKDFYNDIRDIGSIMDEIKKSDVSLLVKKAADDVKTSLKNAIINEQHEGIGMEGSSGLTIWAPNNVSSLNYNDHILSYMEDNTPDFAINSGWGDRLVESIKKTSEKKLKFLSEKFLLKDLKRIQYISESSKENLNKIGSLTPEELERFRYFARKKEEELLNLKDKDIASSKERQMVKALIEINKDDSNIDAMLSIKEIWAALDEKREFLKNETGLTDEELNNVHLLTDLAIEHINKLDNSIEGKNRVINQYEHMKFGDDLL